MERKEAEVPTILGWSDAEFLNQLQDRFGDRLGAFTRLGKRAAYPLALTRVKEHVRERLALIGNAAHTVHPVAGQGFNLGLRDVASIAEILMDAVRAGEDIGQLAVLRRYAEWRQRDNQVTAGFTNGLIRVFSNNAFPLDVPAQRRPPGRGPDAGREARFRARHQRTVRAAPAPRARFAIVRFLKPPMNTDKHR